jgi:hypothetical protein
MRLTREQFYILLALGVVGVYAASDGLESLLAAINPISQDNVFYASANGITQKIAGRRLDSLGRPLTFGAWLAGT